MDSALYANYLNILKQELVPALGCTEPIAIAYAAAKARQVLGEFPEHVEMHLSGNIIKNVKGVTVPNSGGLKGIDVAAVLGIVGGNADRALEVLSEVTPRILPGPASSSHRKSVPAPWSKVLIISLSQPSLPVASTPLLSRSSISTPISQGLRRTARLSLTILISLLSQQLLTNLFLQ